ncbi:MAG TPA: beta-1,3-glucanase family protein [Chitinivibrionales bacterium]|nr:beta-1,3-glucanase family protein [Chitinivibrionales bacterium]
MKKNATTFLIAVFMAGSVFSQTAINLCGKVTDQAGNPLTNTIVRLGQTTMDNGFGQNAIITKTDNTGYYHLGTGTCTTPVVFQQAGIAKSDAFSKPAYIGGQVLFSIPRDNLQVKIGVFDLAGRFVKEIMNSRLLKGNYGVWIDTRSVSSQYYLLKVTVNGASSVFKLEPFSRVQGTNAAQNAKFRTKLEKLTAIVDTLHATEPGYSIGVLAIDALSGPHDFVLTKTTTWNGDTTAFWGNTASYPTNASYVILNRTNGAFPDSKIYWSIQQNGAKTSIATQPTVQIPSGGGRFYIWVAPTDSNNRYFDFVEVNYNGTWMGNTTRVDGWRLPITFRVHSSNGQDNALGDAYEVFYQSRQAKFDEYLNEVPKEFTGLATHDNANIWAPHTSPVNYFGTGGPYVDYFTRYEDSVAVYNPGPAPTTAVGIFECGNGGMGSSPDYCACINRHVGTLPKGTNNANWYNDTNYYKAPPCNYFSYWCHRRSLYNKCYGFPYDDDGGHAAYLGQGNVQWLAIAIGW